MDQQGRPNPVGRSGRPIHIAHRRSPSELTPLMMSQLHYARGIDEIQQQQQQILATHQQLVNMGMIAQQQPLPANFQMLPQMSNVSPHANNYQFPPQMPQQQLAVPVNTPPQGSSHRRNQSALPNVGMGPPPAPSSGASGFGDFQGQQGNQGRENINPRGRGGGAAGSGHTRRHSLALPEAKKAAELAEQKRKASGFQFPLPSAGGAEEKRESSPARSGTTPTDQPALRGGRIAHGRSQSMAVGRGGGHVGRGGGSFQFPGPQADGNGQSGQSDFQRRGSGHTRSSSRNFEGNWRQPNNQQQQQTQDNQAQNMGNFSLNQTANAAPFQPGHRARGSVNQSIGSLGNFQYQGQPQVLQLPQGPVLMTPQHMFPPQGLNPLQLAHLQALQAGQLNVQGMGGLQASQHAQPQMGIQQQQQRKTLFTPYLPQASLPALLADGQLVAGILRVNKKNRSDAYVTTSDLDADIFICGSKDRNRALEGDMVAVELLDVDEVWGQKREKEEKKKRKDNADPRGAGLAVNDATTQPETGQLGEGGVRRRGSLRQRPTQKKNDDVEVEGQSLLLMEEEEINDEQKPLYAGHIVAVIERVAGQMFSGTLGLLRPSSQATKEKQEAERQAREGGSARQQPERQQDKPKIVWFKPTDKRVPLIAIPTEQAPRDFVEKHQEYANRIFVATIKRWPITSLHPFGTLVEMLGEMGDPKVETDALLRDNNFGPEAFTDAVLKSVGFEDWSVESDGAEALAKRRDFRDVETFTIDPNGSKELDDAIHFKRLDGGLVEVGIHVADVAHFIKPNSLVDREAKKRGTAVYLMDRTVNMLPPRLSSEICCLSPGQDRYTVSVVFKIDPKSGHVLEDETWIGKAVIRSSGKLTFEEVDSVISGRNDLSVPASRAEDIKTLYDIAIKFRQARFGDRATEIPPLRLIYQLDDENIPVEGNIFNSSPAHDLVEEISHKTNAFVAKKLLAGLPEKAFLRRQPSPNPRRLDTIAQRMNAIGYPIDTTSSGTLQNSLFQVEDPDIRKGIETLIIKSMTRAKYFVAGKTTADQYQHYALNLPVYTHFTNPSRRYADIIVHRQLEAILSNGEVEFAEDMEALNKTAELCNTKKDSAHSAQEQSVHIESCRQMDKKRQEVGGDLISEGIVLCVYESAFDVLIPEYGFEKRVHCDQLPLKKAEFDKNQRLLELFWEKGVPSSAYIPEDERPKPVSARAANAAAAARDAELAKQRAREQEEAQRKNTETGTMSTAAVDALFDDDEDEDADNLAGSMAGVSLNPNGADRPTQSMPPSPTRGALSTGQAPHRVNSDSKLSQSANEVPESKLTNKEKYLDWFTLREENGDYIQEVREMTRVPIILKTDLTKSPPCLTIRSLNPFAL
ncbi:putative cell wall biogenesis protein phosphatase Ssd1 [Westerdykella ornata]|uniref:Putative cell wall biogenesis protein phosphatase Ssd1 n=1 Tax=Westerdykella ornata TaxID=318751 RepID=A0A6A6JUS1_WESOR|nr:putative cell wall biogenesis protein phosphatase Ssd1 [Westerdykella ornata]KAF2279496.1 putative cell wall biogenesis protein phosphatase Ssd1 [Westerdykella ornata]